MLKPQDCIILIKLLANPGVDWSQRQLSKTICISLAEINGGIKRLEESGLLRKDKEGCLFPNSNAAEEFSVPNCSGKPAGSGFFYYIVQFIIIGHKGVDLLQ